MSKHDSGVMNIKKKVAQLKLELDEANDRANETESTLREKELQVDNVSLEGFQIFAHHATRLGAGMFFKYIFKLS